LAIYLEPWLQVVIPLPGDFEFLELTSFFFITLKPRVE